MAYGQVEQYEIDAWLGGWATELTDDQYHDFTRAATNDPEGNWFAYLDDILAT